LTLKSVLRGFSSAGISKKVVGSSLNVKLDRSSNVPSFRACASLALPQLLLPQTMAQPAPISPKGVEPGDHHYLNSIQSVEKDLSSPSPLHPDGQSHFLADAQSGMNGAGGAEKVASDAVSADVAILAASIEATATRLEAVQEENRQNILLACSRLNSLSDLEAKIKRDLMRTEGLPAIIERDQGELRDLVESRDAFVQQIKELQMEQEAEELVPAHLKVTDFSRILTLEPPREAMDPITMPSGRFSSVEALESSAPDSVKANLIRIGEAREFNFAGASEAAEVSTAEGGEPTSAGRSKAVDVAKASGIQPLKLPSTPAGGGPTSSLAPQTPSSARRSRSISRTNSARALELSKGRYLNVEEARKESDELKGRLNKSLAEQEQLSSFMGEIQVVEGTLHKLLIQSERKEDALAPILEQLSDALDTAREENLAAQKELQSISSASGSTAAGQTADENAWREAIKKADAQREIAAGAVIAAVGAGAVGAGMGASAGNIERFGAEAVNGGSAVNPALDALSPKTVVSEVLPVEVATGKITEEGVPPLTGPPGSATGTGGAAVRLPSGQEPIEAREIPLDTSDIPSSPPIERIVEEKKVESATAATAAMGGAAGGTSGFTPAATTAGMPPSLAATGPSVPALTAAAAAIPFAAIPAAVATSTGPIQPAGIPSLQPQAAVTQTPRQMQPQVAQPQVTQPPVSGVSATTTTAGAAPPAGAAAGVMHPHPDLRIDTQQANQEVPVTLPAQQQAQPHHPPSEAPIAHETAFDRCLNRFCEIQ
jgi:hypothetical protein